MGIWDRVKDEASKTVSDPGRAIENIGTGGLSAAYRAGGIGDTLAKGTGFDTSKQKDLMGQSSAASAEQLKETRPYLNKMNTADTNYLNAAKSSSSRLMSDIDNARAQTADMAKNAKTTYSNEIQPRLKGIMEDAQREAGSAMSLADAGNPNNAVNTAVRDLYNKEGKSIRNMGLADAGILNAMGASSMASQLGGMPAITGSNLQLLSANAQRQGGEAYAKAQQRMADLRQQGIEKGLSESSAQYERGQRAKDTYANSVGNYEAGMDRDISRTKGFRDENLGYGQQKEGIGMDYAGLARDTETGKANRELGYIGQKYGNQQSDIQNQIAMANADNASKRGILGGILSAGGTAAGAYFGGAQGAQIGGQAAGGIAQGMNAPNQYYQPNNRYGSYAA